MEMVWLTFIGTFLLLLVFPTEVYSTGYILSIYDNVDDDFRFFKEKSTYQDMGPIKVFLYIYENIHTKQCMQVVSFNLIDSEDSIDFFMVTCDLKGGELKRDDDMINVANLGYLRIKENNPLWGVYNMPNGKCVQRLYTDENWNFLDEIEEMDLNAKQCQEAIRRKQRVKAKVVNAVVEKKLPPVGQTEAKLLALDDTYVENFHRDESKQQDREALGQFARLTVYPLTHQETGECARFVSINNILTEDVLDYAVVTCDGQEKDELVIVDDMIGFAGLVYVRDHEQDAIWAVFVNKEEKHCILKTYTDEDHDSLYPKNQNQLDWDDCLHLIENKDKEVYMTAMMSGAWNIKDYHDEVTVSRTYEEVVKMLQEDVNMDSPSEDSNVDPRYVKPEGPEFQAVPQPAPLASVGKQRFEEVFDNEKVQPQSPPLTISPPLSTSSTSTSSTSTSFTSTSSTSTSYPSTSTVITSKQEQSNFQPGAVFGMGGWRGKFGNAVGAMGNFGLVKKEAA